MQITIFVKEREKAGVVRPKTEAEKEPLYDVVETNRPNACFVLGLLGVIEKEPK